MPPPPPFGVRVFQERRPKAAYAPSPALRAGADKTKPFSRRAHAPEFCSPPPRQGIFASRHRNREAERRKAHANHVRATQTSERACAPHLHRGCATSAGGAPAFRRSRLRHSPPAITPMAQLQNRVSARHGVQEFCPFAACALRQARSVRTGLFAGRPGTRSRPGAERMSSARGHRGLLRPSKVPSRKAPSASKVTLCNINGDNCQQYLKLRRTWLREC